MKDSKQQKFEDQSPFDSSKEKQVNEFIASSLNKNAGKLINQSSGLVNKFKNINEELKEIVLIEKDLKLKELVSNNKQTELMNLEARLKEKNSS